MNVLDRITTKSIILDGKPSIRGHSLSVETVLEQLASGESYESLSAQYDWLEPEDIQACLLYARQLVSQVKPELSKDDLSVAIPKILEQAPFIKLLVLFGSRARDDSSHGSDWDFAVLCDEEQYQQQREQQRSIGWSLLSVWGIVQKAYSLGDDEIDMVDLYKCSELLAHSVARDGYVLYEREPDLFEGFREKHLISPEKLKEIRQRSKEELTRAIQALKK